MTNCKVPYIEKRYRKNYPQLADVMNKIYDSIRQEIKNSKLFRNYNNVFLFSARTTERYKKQKSLVKKINEKFQAEVIYEKLTKNGSNYFAAINVVPLEQKEFLKLQEEQVSHIQDDSVVEKEQSNQFSKEEKQWQRDYNKKQKTGEENLGIDEEGDIKPYDDTKKYSINDSLEQTPNHKSLQDGLNWLKTIFPNASEELINGLIDNIATGSYNTVTDLIQLSKDFAIKNTVNREAGYFAFKLLPEKERERLLNEGSRIFGIPRGELKTTVEYSQAQQNEIQYTKADSENNIKPEIEQLFNENESLANQIYEALGFNNFSNQEKEQLIGQLRNPLFDLVRGTELYNKYKGETIPYGYSESSWKLLISGINESKLDLNKILSGYKKRLLEEQNTPIREIGIDEKTGLPIGFNPSTGTFEGGFGEVSEKENAITKSKQKIAVLEKFIEQKQQALQLYSQYLEQNPNGSVEQFKSWVDKFNRNKYLQIASDLINPAIEELDNFLLDFLKQFNVKTKQFEELKSRLGVDALGATDVLNKLIWYVKNRNEETLPEEAAHMLVALMGENHPDVKELLANISNWSEYSSIKNQYLPIYKDENKVKIEAVGKLIAKALVKNYKATGLDKSKLQKALDKILNFIEDILDSMNLSNIFSYNQSIADHIAINVLSGNKDYIYKIKNLNPNLNALEEIENNPNAKKIINTFSSNNVKMTGSLAIAGTENIRRPKGQGIHDIDFKVKSFDIFNNEVLPKIPENAVPAHFGWHKNSYSTFAYLIPKEGHSIKVLERKDGFSNGWITSYDLYDENNNRIQSTQDNVTAVDFFVYKEGFNQKDFNFSSNFIPASLVYEGKMSLGGKSNPYFFSRDKDQEDYVLRNPKSFIPFEKHIYYQQSQENNSFQQFKQSLNKPNTNPILQGNEQIKPIYSAVFFDTNEITSKYKPIHPNVFSHHSTIEFKPSDISNLPIGENKSIKIIGRLTTDKVDVLIVENPLSTNKFPHITLSTAEGVKPFESNAEIEKNQDKIKPINDNIQGTVGVFDGKNEIINNTQQEQVKKFAELQERLNNKEFTEAAKNVFESSPELQEAIYQGLEFKQNTEAKKNGLLDYFLNVKKDSIFQELIQIAGNLGIGIEEYESDSPLQANWNGKNVTINKTYGKATSNVIAHEVVHGILHTLTNNDYANSKLNLKLEKFKIELFDYIEKKGINNLNLPPELRILKLDYIKKMSNQEIVTYAFTDSQFSEFLASIKTDAKISSRESFWNKLINIFNATLKELGFTSKLDELIDILNTEVPLFNNNQITPQQKQQALDTYTNYVARIATGIIKNPTSGDYNYTSQVKDIVYHDGGRGKIKQEGFRKDLIGISDGGVLGNGFYFYFDRTRKYDESRSHTESILLNTANPQEKRALTDLAKTVLPFSKKDILRFYRGEFTSIKILSVTENVPYNWSKDKFTGLLEGNLPTKEGNKTFYIDRNDNAIQDQALKDYEDKKISWEDYEKTFKTRIGYDFVFRVDGKKITEEEYINALKEVIVPKEIYIEGVDNRGNKARSTFILRTDGDIQEGNNYLSKEEFTEKEEREYTYEETLGILSGTVIDPTIKGTHGKYIGNYAEALAKIKIDGIIGYFGTGKEIVVFEPEQIHILGSKQDVEGFKRFVDKNNSISDISSLGKLQGDLMESEKGQIGVNKQQLLMLLGPTMYNKPLAQVTVKELLQNSFDAIKARMNITDNKETGNIDIKVDYDNRTISIKDNGIGMTPDIVKNAFLSIGGTNKEGLDVSERSGGFGLAKVQFLLGSEYVKVITIRDGIKTSLEATAVQLYNDDFTINKEQTNEPNGSYVEVKIPESYTTSEGTKREIDFPGRWKSDVEKYRAFDILDKPLIGNVNVSFTHVKNKQEYKKVVPIGENTTKETLPPLFSKIDFAWGSADLYMSTEKKDNPKHQILSSGIYQFNHLFRFKNWENIPYDIVVNIKPSVSSTSEQYPFNNQREGFKNTVTEDIKSLNNYLKKYASGEAEKDAKAVFSNITGLPKVDPNKVLTPEEREKLYADIEKTIAENKQRRIEQGLGSAEEEARKIWKLVIDKEGVKDAETGKVEVSNEKNYSSSFKAEKEIEKVEAIETANFNPVLPQYHNNTNFDYLKIPGAVEFFSDFGSVVLEMVRFAGNELDSDYRKLKSEDEKFFAGVSIDKQYGGVHVRKIINAIFVNPLAFNVSSLEEAVGVALHVTIHEINHTTVSGEGADFTTALGILYGKIYATGKYGLYEGLFRSVYKKHFETFKKLKNEYDKSSTRNLSESFSGDQIKKSITGNVQRDVDDVSTGQSSTEGYTGNQENNTKDKTGDVILSKLLDSKQDIEGFKDFIQGKQFQKLTAEEKAKTIEQITKEHRSAPSAEEFTIQNNGAFLYLPEERKQEIYNNYVNLMDRKREGKAITFEKFQQVFDNLQVYKYKNTFIFGEWDVKNNIFKGRLMSSPSIKELYSSLDVLFSNVDFVASVPSDIGKMLEKKGLYKLDVGKEYNFRGEEMVKNLYFTNKKLVEKVFKKPAENVTEQEVRKYDKFYNYWDLIFKLKKEYENKNYDNLLPILKEIGIYDYNAYRLVKKIKQGKITNEDTESVVKEVIKNSAINKVNIDKTDLINNPEIYNELNTELNKTLATYLSKFGIKTETLEDIQDKLGVDSFSHVDILNKIIYTDKNNTQDYPQQAGKVIAFMMQHNPIMQEITSKMKRLSMFKNLTKDELFEAVGDLISQELHKKTNTELPKSLIDSIKNLIRQFFDFLNNIQLSRINKNIAFIADNILIQNQSLITQSTFKPGSVGKKTTKVSLEKALKQDSFANSIVEKMAKYFILTGSVTLSEQGTIYRPDENQVHDLDWVSSLSRDISIKIFNQLYPNNKYIRNIYNKEYQTDTWLIAPEGYEIVNLQINNLKGTNKIIGYDIVDKNGNIVSSYIPLSDSHTNKIEAKLIDIFTYESITEEKTKNKEITLNSGTKLKISDWRNTFAAKLNFGRLKDIWDYNRFIPNENLFQIDPQKSPERLNQIQEIFNENDLAIKEKIMKQLEKSSDLYSPASITGRFFEKVKEFLIDLFKQRNEVQEFIDDVNNGKYKDLQKSKEFISQKIKNSDDTILSPDNLPSINICK